MEKKMKKSWFNVKLYLDGIKQLKLIGIMSAVIMAFAAFLIPMGMDIENASYQMYYGGGYYSPNVGRVLAYDIMELNPLMILTFLVIVPLMTAYLFNFLNKRNACDFYHSIPDTRECLFVSYGSSVLTWNVFLLLESVIISAVAAGICKWVELEPSNLLLVLINSVVACIFMYGVFMIAMSLTGTSFTNLAVALMILFVPRIVITMYVSILSEAIAVIPFQFGNSILDDRFNIVTNFFTGTLIRGYNEGIMMWESGLYTFVLGTVYCIIGCYLFKKRKSEAATCAAINSKLQCALRLIPSMMVCLIAIYGIFFMIQGRESLNGENIYSLVVLYVIAIIGYFLYELVTTKKLRNVIKAIPGLLWLVVYNIVFVIALLISHNVLLNDIPDGSDVNHVNIQFDSYYSYYDIYDQKDYYLNQLGKIDIESPEIKELLLSELNRNVEAIKADASLHNYNTNPQTSNKNGYNTYSTSIYVTFDCGLSDKNRIIYLSEPALEELLGLLAKNEQVNALCYEQFEFEDISTMNLQAFGTQYGAEVPMEELYRLYQSYNKELQEMSFESAFDLVVWDVYQYDKGDMYGSFTINLKNGEMISLVLNDFFGDTVEDMFLTVNRYNEEEEPIDSFLSGWESAQDVVESTSGDSVNGSGDIRVRIYREGEGNYGFSLWYDYYRDMEYPGNINKDFTDKAIVLLEEIESQLVECDGDNLTEDAIAFAVSYDGTLYNYSNGEYVEENYTKYYIANDEIIELIKEIGGYKN